MNAHKRREQALAAVVNCYRAKVFLAWCFVKVFHWVTEALVAFSTASISKTQKSRKQYQDVLVKRANSLTSDLRRFKHFSVHRQEELTAARVQLLAEFEALKATPPPFRGPKAIFSVLSPASHVLQRSCERRQRRTEALIRISDRIDSDTFYCDLLLWVIMPHSFSEEALGDLNEEFELRASTDKTAARAWYRSQVWSTLKSCIWRRIERLAAITTLIELAFRSHKK